MTKTLIWLEMPEVLDNDCRENEVFKLPTKRTESGRNEFVFSTFRMLYRFAKDADFGQYAVPTNVCNKVTPKLTRPSESFLKKPMGTKPLSYELEINKNDNNDKKQLLTSKFS